MAFSGEPHTNRTATAKASEDRDLLATLDWESGGLRCQIPVFVWSGIRAVAPHASVGPLQRALLGAALPVPSDKPFHHRRENNNPVTVHDLDRHHGQDTPARP